MNRVCGRGVLANLMISLTGARSGKSFFGLRGKEMRAEVIYELGEVHFFREAGEYRGKK